MATTSPKPSILLVQGSFQLPEAYEKPAFALRSRGFTVVQPRLPSLSDQDSPDFAKRGLIDDSHVVEAEAKHLVVDEGKNVMVAMHSYGGLVGSNATPEDFSLQSRRQRGLAGGVSHLFYFAAFILDQGKSVLDTFGGSPNNDVKPNGRFTMRETASTIYHDLPPEEAECWASNIVDQAMQFIHSPSPARLTSTFPRHIPWPSMTMPFTRNTKRCSQLPSALKSRGFSLDIRLSSVVPKSWRVWLRWRRWK